VTTFFGPECQQQVVLSVPGATLECGLNNAEAARVILAPQGAFFLNYAQSEGFFFFMRKCGMPASMNSSP